MLGLFASIHISLIDATAWRHTHKHAMADCSAFACCVKTFLWISEPKDTAVIARSRNLVFFVDEEAAGEFVVLHFTPPRLELFCRTASYETIVRLLLVLADVACS